MLVENQNERFSEWGKLGVKVLHTSFENLQKINQV